MNLIRMPVLFLGAMLAQWWFSTHFAPSGIAPQLLLVLTVTLAARYGAIRAMFAGFFWGLFLDTMSARLLGANALALTLVGYGTASVRRQIDVLEIGPQCVLVCMMTWTYFLLLGLLGLVFVKHFMWVGWLPFLIDPFYNCLFAVLVAAFWKPERSYQR